MKAVENIDIQSIDMNKPSSIEIVVSEGHKKKRVRTILLNKNLLHVLRKYRKKKQIAFNQP